VTSESPSSTVIRLPSDPPIIDQYSNQWTISQSRQVMLDGFADPSTANVRELWYIDRSIWQYTDARLWWSRAGPGAPWMPPAGTPYAPFSTPATDPRIDVLQTSVAALSTQLHQATQLLVGALRHLQADVEEIPVEIIPDPRIDTLAASLANYAGQVTAELNSISAQIDAVAQVITSGQSVIMQRLDLVETQLLTAQATQDAAAGQLDRLVVMVLDLLSPGQKTKITMAPLVVVGSQSIPQSVGSKVEKGAVADPIPRGARRKDTSRMADFPLLNTNIYGGALMQTKTDASGTPTSVPMPLSETVVPVSSSASVNAVVAPSPDGASQWLYLNAAVALSDETNGGGGITVDLTDSSSDVHDTVGPFSVVGAPVVTSITNAPLTSFTITGTQAIPSAPGP
jgi:hypothetical protein